MKKLNKYLLFLAFIFSIGINVKAVTTISESITLSSDITDGIYIPKGANVTINLNGKTVSNTSGTPILNEGTVVITGDGIVTGGDNNTYTVTNHGVMTIKGGTYEASSKVRESTSKTATSTGPSLIANGWNISASSKPEDADDYAYLTIEGGTFNGGLNNVKNDENGILTITGGTFNATIRKTSNGNRTSILNGGKSLSISGGVFTGQINNQTYGKDDIKEISITGGVYPAGDALASDSGFVFDTSLITSTYTNLVIKDVSFYYISIPAVTINNATLENIIITGASTIAYNAEGNVIINNVKGEKSALSFSLGKSGNITVSNSTFKSISLSRTTGTTLILNNNIVSGKLGVSGSAKNEVTINGGEYGSIEEKWSTMTINDAKINGTLAVLGGTSGGVITVNNADILGSVSASTDGIIYINDGIYNGEVNAVVTDAKPNAKIIISGGTFDILPCKDYLKEGYNIYLLSNEKYQVDKTNILTVNASKIAILKGSTLENIFKVEGSEKAYYTTSIKDDNIISLVGTSIKGLNVGTTTITINMADGSDAKVLNVSVYELKDATIESDEIDKTSNDYKDTINQNITNIINFAFAGSQVIIGFNGKTEALVDAITSGKAISSVITTNTLKDIASEEKTEIAKVLNKNANVVGYYDINIEVLADNTIIGNITELSEDITINLDIPDNLPKLDVGYDRVYKVIRYHDGVAEEINATTNDNGTISFASKLYSLYALYYTDVVNNTLDDTPNTSVNNTLIVIGLISLASYFVYKNRYRIFG